jgi:hypothetical protein
MQMTRLWDAFARSRVLRILITFQQDNLVEMLGQHPRGKHTGHAAPYDYSLCRVLMLHA